MFTPSHAGAADKAGCSSSSSSENAHPTAAAERERRLILHPTATQFRRAPCETPGLHDEDIHEAVGAILTLYEGHTIDSQQSRPHRAGPSHIDAWAFEFGQEGQQRQTEAEDEEYNRLEESTWYEGHLSGCSFNTISLSPSLRGSPAAGSFASSDRSFSPPLLPHEQVILRHGSWAAPSLSRSLLRSRSEGDRLSSQEEGDDLAMPTITQDGQLVEGDWEGETWSRAIASAQLLQELRADFRRGGFVYAESACSETEDPEREPRPMRSRVEDAEEERPHEEPWETSN